MQKRTKLENNASNSGIDLNPSSIFGKIKELIMAQHDQNDLCETDVVWIDREDLLNDIEKLEASVSEDEMEIHSGECVSEQVELASGFMGNADEADKRPLTFIELKKIRIAYDLSSLKSMAEQLGISHVALNKLEKGIKLLPDMEGFYKKMEELYDADIERLKFCIEYDFGSKSLSDVDFKFIQYKDNNIEDIMRFFGMTRRSIANEIAYVNGGDSFKYGSLIFGSNVSDSDYIIKRNNKVSVVSESLFHSLFK